MFYWAHGGGVGLWWSLTMLAMMVAFWAFVAWLVLSVVKSNGAPSTHDDPEDILARRFARGEIDQAEYRARLDELAATRRHRAST